MGDEKTSQRLDMMVVVRRGGLRRKTSLDFRVDAAIRLTLAEQRISGVVGTYVRSKQGPLLGHCVSQGLGVGGYRRGRDEAVVPRWDGKMGAGGWCRTSPGYI